MNYFKLNQYFGWGEAKVRNNKNKIMDRLFPALIPKKECGIGIVMPFFGKFTITHLPSGSRISFPNPSCDMCILNFTKLLLIAHCCGFRFQDYSDVNSFRKMVEDNDRLFQGPVPFDGVFYIDENEQRPIDIKTWIMMLNSSPFDFSDIHTFDFLSEAQEHFNKLDRLEGLQSGVFH